LWESNRKTIAEFSEESILGVSLPKQAATAIKKALSL